ncbi:hypothetical protein [Phytohabitans aurantiacus]|uniref:Calcium-binding protein n=1 Tax=Phytohabitans aurantiacus TaxID=3016789 RepID=A0ABQ5R4B7_9ACTN|nr:hypothetical protein [Phytohabitans aurantiacus]GLI01053.1 hypothetical protein Pa4123_63290 [Phytohabitans aurantiacus]
MAEISAETVYPRLREVLDPRFASLSDAELEAAFESAFGEGVTPAEYEEFFNGLGKALSGVARDVGQFAQQAAPVVATGFQGALQGAAAGSRLGPWGALGGALTGAAGAALSKHGQGAARDVGGVLSGVVGTAGALRGGGAPDAAANLLGLLRRPEMGQAIAGLLGGSGTAVPVGRSGTPVPASAFAGLLSALARQAEAEALATDTAESVPAYLVGPTGQLVADPADPDQRAARLFQLLARETEYDEAADWPEAEYDDADDDVLLYAPTRW